MALTNFYPISGGDGQVDASASTYASAHDATTGTATTNETTQVFCQNDKLSESSYSIKRYFFPFDTSSIPDNATITSATFSWYFTAANPPTTYNPNADAVSLIQTSQASSTSLTAADFDNVGTTKGASDINFADITNSAHYIDMPLNATGLSWISKTGITYLGIRSKNDIANSAPTGRSFLNAGTFADSATNKPVLVVNYTTTSIKSINGLAVASVKSKNGLAMGSIKSINGLA